MGTLPVTAGPKFSGCLSDNLQYNGKPIKMGPQSERLDGSCEHKVAGLPERRWVVTSRLFKRRRIAERK